MPEKMFCNWLDKWLTWEKSEKSRRLYLIGTDIGKGIVPVDANLRRYRDLVGKCYQIVAQKAERVDLIWYGLNETLKKEEEQ
mgnify:CR=1 FL=1